MIAAFIDSVGNFLYDASTLMVGATTERRPPLSTEKDAQSVETTVAALLQARDGVLNSCRALQDIAGRLKSCNDSTAQSMAERIETLVENTTEVANLLEIHRSLAANRIQLPLPISDPAQEDALYHSNGSGSGGNAVLRRWLRPPSKQAS